MSWIFENETAGQALTLDSETYFYLEKVQNRYREEVPRLVAEGKIKHTAKYVEKSSDETVEKIYKNYLTKQLDETNDHITDTLIKQLSELMTSLELVDDGESLEKNLENNELLKRDVKNILCYITPYIPFVGLMCGRICLGKHVMRRGKPKESKDQGTEEGRCCF